MQSSPRTQYTLALLASALLATTGSSIASSADLPDGLAAGWKGQKTCENLHEDDQIRVLRCTFPPGVGHERHYHPRVFGYVLSVGKMQVTSAKGTETFEDKVGDNWVSDPIEWHEGVNVGDTTVSYLVVEMKD
jgi:beta-alanine degradation protein BauB